MEKKNKQVAVKNNTVALNNEKGMLSFATQFVRDQKLILPANYDVAGAVSGLYLQLLDVKDKNNKSALEVVTPHSLKKAVMDMVSKGLDPRKKQCYPIVYGDSLNLQVGYFGNQRLAQTFNKNLSEFHSQVIYKDDEYETKIEADGRKTLVKHVQPFGDRSLDNMIGCYSIVQIGVDDSKNPIYDLEDMTIAQIKTSWAQTKSGGAVHKNFSEEMAKKTVINRQAKRFINTSDDADVIAESKSNVSSIPISIDSDGPSNDDAPGEYVEVDYTVDEVMPEAEGFDDDNDDMFVDFDQENEEVLTVKYSAWSNEYKPSGEWEQVSGTYNPADKTVKIRKRDNV